MKAIPYFTFTNSLEVLAFYEKVGAKILEKSLASDPSFDGMPADMKPADPEHFVMNASFEIFGNRIFLSDAWNQNETIDHSHSNLSFVFDQEDPEEIQEVKDFFELAVANGFRIEMPLEATEWTNYFGMLVDPYGLTWMFNGE